MLAPLHSERASGIGQAHASLEAGARQGMTLHDLGLEKKRSVLALGTAVRTQARQFCPKRVLLADIADLAFDDTVLAGTFRGEIDKCFRTFGEKRFSTRLENRC